jgi:hypothetical protein
VSGRRLVILLIICAAIGVPAVALRAACAGKSCSSGGGPEARIPFCPLPDALKGIGTRDIEDARGSWPFLESLLHDGAGTLRGTTGSLPLDPAATLTTIGTGGLPSQHGITGSYVRNDNGDVVPAWGDGAPLSVIATLPDELDEMTGERAMFGLVATAEKDRGLIGGNWYPDHDRDAITVSNGAGSVAAAGDILGQGFGRDEVPDILGVVLAGADADARIRQIVTLARRASGGSLLVVVGGTRTTGTRQGTAEITGSSVVDDVEGFVEGDAAIVAEAVPGGLFLDQATLAGEQISGDAAVQALLRVTTPDGQRMMADAFQGFAVSFARYC